MSKFQAKNGGVQKTYICTSGRPDGRLTCTEIQSAPRNSENVVAKPRHSSKHSEKSRKECAEDCECYITGEVPMKFNATKSYFQNPFVPMSGQEILNVSAVIMSDSRFLALPPNPAPPPARQNTVFVSTVLQEPQKSDAKNFQPGDMCKRIAQTLIYVNPTNTTYQVLTDLANPPNYNIISFEKVNILPPMGASANTDSAQFLPGEMEAMFASNPEIVKALAKRGLTTNALTDGTLVLFAYDFDTTLVMDSKCCSSLIDVCDSNKRISVVAISKVLTGFSQVITDVLAFLPGLTTLVNFTDKVIYKVVDEFVDSPPLPYLVPDSIVPVQHPNGLNPIMISQPGGPSYTLNGNELVWSNWKMQLSWHPRTGVQLYNIKYTDNGVDRTILYKMSITESANYYNVQTPIGYESFNSYDGGAYPLLNRMTKLEKGLDIPHYATYVNIPFVDINGQLVSNPAKQDQIAIFEEDDGIMYRTSGSFPFEQGEFKGSRDQRLCIRFQFVGVVYLWVYTYYFSADGKIELDVKVCGRVLLVNGHEANIWNSLITKNILAANHSHYFNVRLDFDLDGENNTVIETNQYPVNDGKTRKHKNSDPRTPGQNLCGQAATFEHTHLKTELSAVRDQNPETNREWTIINENVTNRVGEHVGYTLRSTANSKSLANSDSAVKQRFGFLKHDLFVTKYHDNEQFAGGNFPLMACEDVGLGKYIKNDESVEDEDIVVWYNMFYSHHPSTEDYPFVPAKFFSLKLYPENFFELNPGLLLNTHIN